MKKLILNITIFLFVLNILNFAAENIQDDIIQFVCKDVTRYFVNQYKVHPEDVEVQFKRLPAEMDENPGYEFKISNSIKDYKPGYQTIWIEVLKSGVFKMKFPVSFEISIQKEVAVSKTKIRRGQSLNSDRVEIKKLEINTNPDNLFASVEELSEYESAKYIKPGTMITNKMVRIPPLLKRGDNIEIRLSSGNLLISTPGIAREDGYLGDEIKVTCQNSRKKMTGIVQSPDLVLISSIRN